jgi:hypothetical protein
MMKITGQKGFHITFANGYTVSVQFGPGNYGDNYDMRIGADEQRAGEQGSARAECAVWKDGGDLLEGPGFNGDTVVGYIDANRVLELMKWAAVQTRQETK